MTMNTLRLKVALAMRDKTLSAVAKELNVPLTSMYERYRGANIREVHLKDLADVLDVPPAWLLDEAPPIVVGMELVDGRPT